MVAALFLNLRHAAELAQRRAARFLGRDAPRYLPFDLTLEVKAQFFVELLLSALPVENGAQKESCLITPTHIRNKTQAGLPGPPPHS